MLIAMLNDIGFTGFEEEDNTLKAFISKADLDQKKFVELNKYKILCR